MTKKGLYCYGIWAFDNGLQVIIANEMLFLETRFKILSNSKMLSLLITRLIGMALVTSFVNF
jgi:hypothetical protein